MTFDTTIFYNNQDPVVTPNLSVVSATEQLTEASKMFEENSNIVGFTIALSGD